MRSLFSSLIVVVMTASLTLGGLTATAQKAEQPKDALGSRRKEMMEKLPPELRRGASPEAKEAWEKLTPQQREQVKAKVHEAFDKTVREHKEKKRAEKAERKGWKEIVKGKATEGAADVEALFTDPKGERKTLKVKERAGARPAPAEAAKAGARAPQAGPLSRAGAWGAEVASVSGSGFKQLPSAKAGLRAEPLRYAPRAVGMAAVAAAVQMTAGAKTVDQYVADFYQGALGRQPSPAETRQWAPQLAQAQQQGHAAVAAVADSLGRMLFASQEYANRWRSDYDYVGDLYLAWLQRPADQGGQNWWTGEVGLHGRGAVLNAFPASGEFHELIDKLYAAATFDTDLDGLTDHFEAQVADAFTPIYHISAYEPDHFATFNPFKPQTVAQRLGQTPYSHYRVQPLGFDYDYQGRLVSVLRIDYLTLLDHDSGLVTGGNCDLFPGLTSFEGAGAHNLDNERAAVLVAAPVWSYAYNLDPMSYGAYSYYTAAHEHTVFDKSRYIDFYSPVPAGWHIHLALSLSKHGTYTFNPDYLWMLPDEIIWGTLAAIDYYCFRWTWDGPGWNDLGCLAMQYYAYGAFYECAVERFFDQGGRFAEGRVNVGEPTYPAPGYHFIQDWDTGLYQKLADPVF